MNDRPEHPERASSATALVEVAQLDLRYEGCRLKSPAVEDRLLAAIAQAGIQEPLQGVQADDVRILLNGFKRLRCARKLHLATVPFVALAADETAGIVCLLRAANDHALSLLEQARFLDELKGAGGLSVAEIAQQVGRSPAWVSLRLGVLAELSPVVRAALFEGAFPVYSYLYTLRPFRRLNGAAAVDEFVRALHGKKLSARQIEQLAHGFFRGPESLREQIRRGHLTLPLQQLKELPEDPDGCSEFERVVVVDLEQAQKILVRLMTKSADPSRLSSRPFRAQAHLLCAGLLSRLPAFTKTIQKLHDHCGQT
jgi:ParB-like chromosome segregation protein Spo0J